jgi:ABC-type branched-subunit amino acid transport system ATPase component
VNTLIEPATNQRQRIELQTEGALHPVGVGRELLTARGLQKAFGGRIVLDGIDLALREGEVVLLRGENGSGKTTLLNILTGNLEPDSGSIEYRAGTCPRTYHFPRRWWQELNPWDHFRPEFVASEGLGRTWQDVRLFRAQTLRDNIAVAKQQSGESPMRALLTPGRVRRREREIAAEVDASLAQLDLAGRESSSADKISLGQTKRVAIARAIAAGARILFLDEPLAGLDYRGMQSVLALLTSLVREHRVTMVIIEHVFNLGHLQALATSDWLLEKGKIHCRRNVAISASSEIEADPQSPVRAPSWFNVLTYDAIAVEREPLPRGATVTRIRRVDRRSADPILDIRNLVVERGARIALGLDDAREITGFDLALYEGEIVILQAPNGWGKTSLLDAVAGITPSSSSAMLLRQQSLAGKSIWDIRSLGVVYVPATTALFPSLSIQELKRIASPSRASTGVGTPQSRTALGQLSGGEIQKLKTSTMLQSEKPAQLLCLDEPFSALDRAACEALAHNLASVSAASVLIAMPQAAPQFD